MTILAGILSRGAGRPVPAAARDELRRLVSRDPRDEPAEFGDDRCCLWKVDTGAYGEPAAVADADGRVSLLAGEPLLSRVDGDDQDGDFWQGRDADLARLHRSWVAGDWDVLRKARGTFCAAHYDAAAGRLSVVADKLCLRPLYYWAGEEFFVFATALRVFEGLSLVPREMDLRAVTEVASIGLPLGTRTPYADVSLLRAAEIVEVDARRVSRRQYWRWDDLTPSKQPADELAGAAHAAFSRAVARRLRGERSAVAFLSGGLDSRSVATALHAQGVRLHTFNFAPAGTQDQIFGRLFAAEIGALHGEAPAVPGDTPWSQLMADAWGVSPRRAELPVARDRLVWSGDGGSVGLGHVYVYESVVELLRAGNLDEAVAEFLARHSAAVPQRLLSPSLSKALAPVLHVGLREELADLRCADPGRALYLFLMLNDQRRHLERHFEEIDLHRLEFQLPFYDADFIAAVARVPVAECVGHKFYMKFVARFPPVFMSAPWQSYPGHEPCPVPVPPDLGTQWQRGEWSAERKRELLGQAAEMLKASDFPDELLKRRYLSLATLAYRAGLRDYSYLIQAARTYHKYWSRCGGRLAPPPDATSAP